MRNTMIALVVVSAAAGCTQNEDAKDYFDRVEHGTDWQLTIAGGTRVDNSYTGCVPDVSAEGVAHVPSAHANGTEFDFSLVDDGDIGHNYVVDAGFLQRDDDGSSLQCEWPNPETDETGWCTWLSGTFDPSIDLVRRLLVHVRRQPGQLRSHLKSSSTGSATTPSTTSTASMMPRPASAGGTSHVDLVEACVGQLHVGVRDGAD